MSNIIDAVKSAIVSASPHLKNESIFPEHRLKEDLRLDSMSSLLFLIKLEESINGFIADPSTLTMTDLETVSSVSEYIRRQLDENKEYEKH